MPTMDVYTRAKIIWLTEGNIFGMGIPPSCSIQTSCWSKKPKSEQYQQGWIASCTLYIFPNKYMKKMRWGMAQNHLRTPNWTGFCYIYIYVYKHGQLLFCLLVLTKFWSHNRSVICGRTENSLTQNQRTQPAIPWAASHLQIPSGFLT